MPRRAARRHSVSLTYMQDAGTHVAEVRSYEQVRRQGGRGANAAGSLRPRKWTVLPSLPLFSPAFSFPPFRSILSVFISPDPFIVSVVRVSINCCVPPQLERRAVLRNVHGLATKSSSSSQSLPPPLPPPSSQRYAGEQSRERTDEPNQQTDVANYVHRKFVAQQNASDKVARAHTAHAHCVQSLVSLPCSSSYTVPSLSLSPSVSSHCQITSSSSRTGFSLTPCCVELAPMTDEARTLP